MKERTAGEAAGRGQDLQAVVNAFERWRAERKIGQRIPQELWQAAVTLHPRHSVYRIARLHLDSGDLRERVRLKRMKGGSRNAKGPQFVQLPMAAASKEGVADCWVRARDGKRARITMRLRGAGTGAVIEVLRQLWSRGS
jgi:hypothetical protein